MNISRAKRFWSEKKFFSQPSKVLSSRLKKQNKKNNKNITDTTFSPKRPAGNIYTKTFPVQIPLRCCVGIWDTIALRGSQWMGQIK